MSPRWLSALITRNNRKAIFAYEAHVKLSQSQIKLREYFPLYAHSICDIIHYLILLSILHMLV